MQMSPRRIRRRFPVQQQVNWGKSLLSTDTALLTIRRPHAPVAPHKHSQEEETRTHQKSHLELKVPRTSTMFFSSFLFPVGPLPQCYEKKGRTVTARDSHLFPRPAHKALNEKPFTPVGCFKRNNCSYADSVP